jgi:hypothetical protein
MYEVKMKVWILFSALITQIFEDNEYGTKLNATEWRVCRHLELSLETF